MERRTTYPNATLFVFVLFQQVEVIEVRVLQLVENKVVQVQGMPVELQTFEVCDATGQTGLTVWDRLILSVQQGKCYRLDCLSTRKLGDRTVLTTTPSTVVTTVAHVGQPASLRLLPVRVEETVRGPVTGVKILAKPRCPRCNGIQDRLAVKLLTHRCEHCAILQRTAAYIITYSGVLIVVGGDGEERSLSLSNSAVFAFAKGPSITCSAHDGEGLEEVVMAMPEVEVTVDAEGLVVCFAAAAVTAAEATVVQGGTGSIPDAAQASTSYARDTPQGHDDDDDEGLAEFFHQD